MKTLNFFFLSIKPDVFKPFLEHSIMKRAIEKGFVKVNLINIRDFTNDKHKSVDDTQYGGGGGMVLMIEPIYNAIKEIKSNINGKLLIVLLTPQGKIWEQKKAKEMLEEYDNFLLISGNYEGFDERIRDLVDVEVSIGNYILTGGELPSLIIFNSLIRLIPNVIKENSHINESFSKEGRLDYPVFTKPFDFKGQKVPEILLSGHHKKIDIWRKIKSLKNTIKKRPNLIKKYPLTKEEKELIKKEEK